MSLAPVPQTPMQEGGAVSRPWFIWLTALRALVLTLSGAVHLVRGDPNGTEYGAIGHLALRLDGAPGSTLYTKESGTTTAPTTSDWRAV